MSKINPLTHAVDPNDVVFPLGIVVPTRWEAAALLKDFGFRKKQAGFYEAETPKGRLLLVISGVGMEAARKASYRLCNAGAKCLVSAGFCGALSADLQVGDVVAHRIMTVRNPVRTQSERLALSSRANAVAVDMESQAIVEAGTLRAVPIRLLRVVSDTVGDDLSPLFGSAGNFSAIGIAFRLLNPSVWPLAARLARHSRVAKVSLSHALGKLVA